jgi:hypothetical protein
MPTNADGVNDCYLMTITGTSRIDKKFVAGAVHGMSA